MWYSSASANAIPLPSYMQLYFDPLKKFLAFKLMKAANTFLEITFSGFFINRINKNVNKLSFQIDKGNIGNTIDFAA